MKKVATTILKIIMLISIMTNQASAVASFDYISDITIGFNQEWVDYTPMITSTTLGSGNYTAFTAPSQNVNTQELWYNQTSRVFGTAGNGAFNQNGTSYAKNEIYTSFNFDFGTTPTDLSITWMDGYQVIMRSRQLPWNPDNETGEFIGYWPTYGGGGTGYGLKIDGEWMWAPGGWEIGDSTTFNELSGQHTVQIWTDASETAIANYPYEAPPPVVAEPSTFLLLGSRLIGLVGFGREV